MFYEALNHALSVGCGSSLATMIGSPLFGELLNKHKTTASLPRDSDEAVAAMTGHNRMGVLLNNMSEAKALAKARSNIIDDPFNSSAETRALTECLGHAVIKAAEDCLPDEFRSLAQRWRETNDPDVQIQIAQQLYFELRSESQEARGELTQEVVLSGWHARLDEGDGEDRFLPALYGKWNRDSNPANCQGKSQMVMAFAKLAGARAMSVCPVESAHKMEERARNKIFREVILDVSERGLYTADSSFCAGLRAAELDQTLFRRDTFHIGIALELCDGRWLLLDPHGLSWGVFGDQWQLSEVYNLLEKYHWTLPGLQLTRHDSGAAKTALEELVSLARRLIQVSRDLGLRISEANPDMMELVDMVLQHGEFDLVVRLDMLEKGEVLPEGRMNEEFRKYLAMVMFLGGEEVLWDPMRVLMDPGFLPKRIGHWLTFYHATALNLFTNRLTNEGKLLHPICDFGLAEYHLGISLLNSVEFFLPGGKSAEGSRFFLGHSFDQVTFYNAMSDPEYRQVALKSLEALPFVHPLCAKKMWATALRIDSEIPLTPWR